MRTTAKFAAGMAAALAAAYVVERVAVARTRRRPDPEEIPRAWLPTGAETNVTSADGAVIHVVSAGDGPPLVLSHGVMLSTAIWPLVFDEFVARGFRVIAYDQRGHGKSTVGEDGFTVGALGRDLWAVLRATDARDGLVLGHSMGGIAVLSLFAEHPESSAQLAGVVLAATTPATYRMPSLLANGAAAFAGLPVVGWALGSQLHGTALARVGFGPSPTGGAVEAARRVLAGTDAETLARANRALVGVDLRPVLPSVDVPTLVLAGRHDRVVPGKAPAWLAAGLPHAQVVEIDAGHMLPLEAPGAVVAETAAFAARLGLGAVADT